MEKPAPGQTNQHQGNSGGDDPLRVETVEACVLQRRTEILTPARWSRLP